MPPQTLQNIENGKTKSLSLSARRLLAPVLRVREDELMVPIGTPLTPLPGEQSPIDDLMLSVCQSILAELREIKQLLQMQQADQIADFPAKQADQSESASS